MSDLSLDAGGSIVLNSSDPFAHPIIDPKLLTSDFDMATMVESVKAAQRLTGAHAWDGYITGVYADAVNTTTDAGIVNYVRQWGTTIKHPFSTAAANKDPRKGVVDGKLLLKKARGVRIVDASVFVSCLLFVVDFGSSTCCVLRSRSFPQDILKRPSTSSLKGLRMSSKPPGINRFRLTR